jgi:CDP-diacylglycerol--serine O-phosphatidyltransferase
MIENQVKAKRGVYLLPSILTTFGLFCGFYAVIASIKGNFEIAAMAIFFAMLWDALDGRVARMTNTQTAFGAEYDSMADLISFGVAPAILVYQWTLTGMGKIGWVAAFIYAACAALRLARFNTQVGIADKRYFQGLPSPAAAAVLAGMIGLYEWLPGQGYELGLSATSENVIGWLIAVVCGILMVSNVRYHSFKEVNFKGRSSFRLLLLAALIIIVIAYEPPLVLFTFFFLYMLSGPILTVWSLQQKRRQKKRSKSL